MAVFNGSMAPLTQHKPVGPRMESLPSLVATAPWGWSWVCGCYVRPGIPGIQCDPMTGAHGFAPMGHGAMPKKTLAEDISKIFLRYF